ncbi:UNVERIFIED_CONTAM: hypothetical protein NCL1_59234 [Trichonephila clavipes]
MPNEKNRQSMKYISDSFRILYDKTRDLLHVPQAQNLSVAHIVICSRVSKYAILLKPVQQKIGFVLSCMKMEKQVVVLEKESWSI